MLTITKEKQLQDHLIQNFSKHFDFSLVASEVVISNGRIDLLGEDEDNVYIVELKRDQVNEFTIIQLSAYIEPVQKMYPNKNVIAIAAAPEIDKKLNVFDLPVGIRVKAIEGVKCDESITTKQKFLRHRMKPGVAIDRELHVQVKELSDQTRIPISKLFDEALKDLIEKHQNLAGKQ